MQQTQQLKDMPYEQFMQEINDIVNSRDKNVRRQVVCTSDGKQVVGADSKFYPDADYTAYGN